jgi:hypothetical protein
MWEIKKEMVIPHHCIIVVKSIYVDSIVQMVKVKVKLAVTMSCLCRHRGEGV